MTAREMVLLCAPEWSEEQARRALLAAEGRVPREQGDRLAEHRALMQRAAAFRERQKRRPDSID